MDWSIENEAALLGEIWSKLVRAKADRRSPWRTPVVSTLNVKAPDARTVVLREVDPARSTLSFHTDLRSAKTKQLRENSSVTWVFWDPRAHVQLRVYAYSRLFHLDETARAKWARQSPGARALFELPGDPGTPRGEPSRAPADPFDAFVWVETRAVRFDWLWLTQPNHVRWGFELPDGAATRLVP